MSDMTMNKPGKATESMIKIKMSKAGIQQEGTGGFMTMRNWLKF